MKNVVTAYVACVLKFILS